MSLSNKENNNDNITDDNKTKKGETASDATLLNIKKIQNIDSDPIVLIDIEIKNGKKKTVKVNKKTKPDEFAYDFCKKNNLNFQSMKDISLQIEKAISTNNNNITESKTLSPKSMKKSNDIVYNNKKINYGEYLYIKGKDQIEKVNQKIKKIKKEADFENEIELTFKPKLIKHSSMGNFSTLKKDKKKTINNSMPDANKPNEQCTFKPKINKNIKVKTKFNERLLKYTESLNYLHKNRNFQMVDTSTGQPFFQPKLIAKNKSNINNKNVFQINYEYASVYRRNRDFLLEYVTNQYGHCNLYPNDTDKIFTEKKISAFKYIFELLDSDEDGTISAININRKALGNTLDNIISPIITQIIQQKAIIEENDFIQAMDVLFSAMNMNDRGKVLNVKKKIKKKKNDVKIVSGIHKERLLKSASTGMIHPMKRI